MCHAPVKFDRKFRNLEIRVKKTMFKQNIVRIVSQIKTMTVDVSRSQKSSSKWCSNRKPSRSRKWSSHWTVDTDPLCPDEPVAPCRSHFSMRLFILGSVLSVEHVCARKPSTQLAAEVLNFLDLDSTELQTELETVISTWLANTKREASHCALRGESERRRNVHIDARSKMNN